MTQLMAAMSQHNPLVTTAYNGKYDLIITEEGHNQLVSLGTGAAIRGRT